MQHSDPNSVRASIPLTVRHVHYDETVPNQDIRKVLAENVRRLIAHDQRQPPETKLLRALMKKAKISMGSAERILAGKTSIGVALLDRVARKFKLQAYQLLIPGLDPESPQWVPVTPEQKKQARAVKLALDSLGEEVGDEIEASSAGSGPAHRGPAGPGEKDSATPGRRG